MNFLWFPALFSFHLRRFSFEKKKSNVIPVNEALALREDLRGFI
jgi:hypothetical protein